MGTPPVGGRRSATDGLSRARRYATASVVVAIALLTATAGVGSAAASPTRHAQRGGNASTYTVRQGDQCHRLRPITGSKSVVAFYDYHSPYDNVSWTNQTGPSYSSEGTTALQRPNGSALFLYRDGNGTLSLVMVHGSTNDSDGGGSVTFNFTGLPDDGSWAVRDDKYPHPTNFDQWRNRSDGYEVDWTFSGGRTDGGAYEGLGSDFRIRIDPAFNDSAALAHQHYNGTISSWAAVSGARGGPRRFSLSLSDPVTISTEPCSAGGASSSGASGPASTGPASASAAGNGPGAASDNGGGAAAGGDDGASQVTRRSRVRIEQHQRAASAGTRTASQAQSSDVRSSGRSGQSSTTSERPSTTSAADSNEGSQGSGTNASEAGGGSSSTPGGPGGAADGETGGQSPGTRGGDTAAGSPPSNAGGGDGGAAGSPSSHGGSDGGATAGSSGDGGDHGGPAGGEPGGGAVDVEATAGGAGVSATAGGSSVNVSVGG
ncbi:MAG: hypothetical protein ABEJ31_05425 [Haloarculaceae archaeon]